VLLLFVALGALGWFKHLRRGPSHPRTYGETLVLLALVGLFSLVLLLLLVLLFRNLLRVYVGAAAAGLQPGCARAWCWARS